jgi:hypothetical protein
MARFITRSSIAVDTTGPTAPAISATASSSSTITITRTLSAFDVSGVALYETQRSPSGAGTWTTVDTSSTSPLTVSGLSASTAYDFRQRGVDTLGNLGTFSATASATTQATSSSAFFTDDFSSGDFTRTQNGFNWNGNPFTSVVSCAAFPTPLGSTKCVKYDWGANAAPSGGSHDAQLNYDLGGSYTHLFFRFYVYYPSGSESPSVGPAWGRSNTSSTNNNKMFRIGDNSDWASTSVRMGFSTYGTSSGGSTGCDRVFSEFGSPAFGGWLAIGYSGRDTPYSLGNFHSGVWKKVEFEISLNTGAPSTSGVDGWGSGNGILRCWINDNVAINITDAGMAPLGTFLKGGYILGAMNMAADNANSISYLADFAVSATGRV